ncbi:hypothetical protein S7711_05290 [Stachybotrys chartarum IBT 7711]|uniref:TauD/TfdA-like domain-containing protein n=1 Tax=Stachybotrys chartarum (strain CBS 109288 / IBT 7711) TaxID=1280523 RepID=A0A084ALD8_STACB|nr:hypothetical protein S7711_05290 [Stachybotrys chartarum IBT 7711]KFA50839.1 hypothetical protein S40293_05798 [Stachybotrys chartarum IBT 40293]KFA73355.1 hypothetical protein S40288_03881 [Stachybotrys chartarum IBT 40288]
MSPCLDNWPAVGPIASAQDNIGFPVTPAELSQLPSAFPAHLESALAWTGRQFADQASYVHELSETEIQEIHDALRHFKCRGEDGDLVSPLTFPLPSLGPRLKTIRQDIYSGKGFALIRGLDPKKYTVEDLTMVYLGIQSHVSDLQGRQDKKGNMLVHVIADSSTAIKAAHHRHSTAPITFHNEEAGDVVSWLTRSIASQGGRCIIASAYMIYNVLAATRPDVIRTLARADWPFAIPKFHCRPILFYHEGRMIINFGRTALMGSPSHPRPAHLPALTSRQVEALDIVERIAQAVQLEIPTESGDIHLINNMAILHRREGFVNGQSTDFQRHLVRMRIRDGELGWSIPPQLQDEWTKAFGPKGSRVWHLEPMPEGYYPLRSFAN